MATTLPLNPDLPTLSVPCRPFGCLVGALVLVLPPPGAESARGLLWAYWAWGKSDWKDATIGRA